MISKSLNTEFPSYNNSRDIIQHLTEQKSNTNDEDNLISVYLTEADIDYLIRCVEKEEKTETNLVLQQLTEDETQKKIDEMIDTEIEFLRHGL